MTPAAGQRRQRFFRRAAAGKPQIDRDDARGLRFVFRPDRFAVVEVYLALRSAAPRARRRCGFA